MINTTKLIFLISFFTFSHFLANAQRPHKHMEGKAFDGKVIEALNLNADQLAAVEILKKDSKVRAEAIRSDQSIADKRAALKESRDQNIIAFESILNEEQLLKFKSARADKKITRDKRKAERETFINENKEAIDAMKAEMAAYHEGSIRPALLEERIAFDKVLNASDKKLIEEIRKDLRGERKNAKKDAQSGDRPRGKAIRQGRHNTHAYLDANPDKKIQLMDMVQKYQSNLAAVETKLAANKITWENDMKAIKEKHLPKAVEKDRPERKNRNVKGKTDRLDMNTEAERVKFLLMRTEKRAKK